jgi:hypothetical protein
VDVNPYHAPQSEPPAEPLSLRPNPLQFGYHRRVVVVIFMVFVLSKLVPLLFG